MLMLAVVYRKLIKYVVFGLTSLQSFTFSRCFCCWSKQRADNDASDFLFLHEMKPETAFEFPARS